MTIATDGKGNYLTLENGEWKPAKVAVNQQGEKSIFDGKEWLPETMPMGADIPRGGFTPEGADRAHGIVRKGLPIAGASVLTMLAPQAGIPALMGLGGLGAAGGEAAGQLYDIARGEEPLKPTEAAKEIGKEALLGTAAEGILGGAGKLGKFMLSPKTVRGARTLELAKEAGLPVSRAAIEPRWPTKFISATADITPAGRVVGDHYRKQLVDKTTDYATSFTKDVLGKTEKTPFDIATSIGESLKKAEDFSPYYEDWNNMLREIAHFTKGAKKEGEILLDSVNSHLTGLKNKYLDQGMSIAEAKREIVESVYGFGMRDPEGAILRKVIDDDVITIKDLDKLRRGVWKKYGKQADVTIENRKALKEMIIGDVDSAAKDIGFTQSAEAAIEAGDTVFRETTEALKKTPIMRQFTDPARYSPGKMRFESQPEDMVNLLINRGSSDELLNVKGFLLKQQPIEGAISGKEAWAGLEYKYINNLIDQATTTAKTGERVFQPGAFVDVVEANKETLQSVFPGAYTKIQDFADLSKGMLPEFQKAQQGLIERATVPLGVQGALFAGGSPTATAVANGFGALTSFGLLSNSSKKALGKMLKGAGKVFRETVARPSLMLGGEELTF